MLLVLILIFTVAPMVITCSDGPYLPNLSFRMADSMAGGYVDMAFDGQIGPTVTAFRNQTFALHIGGFVDKNGFPTNLLEPRYEYLKPTDFKSTIWLQQVTGETWTAVPGTNYTDLANPANRAAIVRAEQKWCAQIRCTRIFVDCIYETAPGTLQAISAAFLIKDLRDVGFKVALNTGDPYKAAERDETKPAGYANKYATLIFIEVGIDVSAGQFNLSRYVLLASVINSYVAMDKGVVAGVFDLDGKNAAQAASYFNAAVFNQPSVYKHYNVSHSYNTNVGQQIPGGKPVTEPIPQTPSAYGLNADISPLGPLYLPADNWCNLDITSAPIDPNDSSIRATIKSYPGYNSLSGGVMHPDFNPTAGIPVVAVNKSTPRVKVSISDTSESDLGPYPIPAEADASWTENKGGTNGDRHLLIVDVEERKAYELAYTTKSGGSWSARYGAIFDLSTNARRPEGWTSTDAAGLCVSALLARYDEAGGNGEIRHALRVSIKHTNGHVYPASHTGATYSGGIALGTRLRLRSDFPEAGYSQPMQKIIRAMKRYGLIVADQGGNMYVQGTQDSRWPILNSEFHKLSIDDFRIIKLGWKPTT